MLRDDERNRKFYQALRHRLVPGARVLDIGAGTGVWAIAAAKLGASRVLAVEMDELLVGLIRILAEEHGVSDRVEAVCMSSFDLPRGPEFDLVVSETIGYLGYDEGIVEIMADARKRLLRPGGHITPETISLHAAAGKLNIRTDPLPVGIDLNFDALVGLNLNSPRVLKRTRDVTLVTRPVRLISTDLRSAEATPPLTGLTAIWEEIDIGMPLSDIDCVIVWVESRLAPRVKLSTRRGTTSWFPTIYRIAPATRQFTQFEFNLSLTRESNYWTATFIDNEVRESRSYSPEFAAAEMIAAARVADLTTKAGSTIIARDSRPPVMIELRDATTEDEAFLRTLYRATRKEEVANFGWPEVEQDAFLEMQFSIQQRSYQMEYPDASRSVILCDGLPAGRLLVDRSGDTLLLADIAILPEFRGLGIASRLIKQLQREAPAITLSVDRQNEAAKRLYEKHGFIAIGDNDITLTMKWSRTASERS